MIDRVLILCVRVLVSTLFFVLCWSCRALAQIVACFQAVCEGFRAVDGFALQYALLNLTPRC